MEMYIFPDIPNYADVSPDFIKYGNKFFIRQCAQGNFSIFRICSNWPFTWTLCMPFNGVIGSYRKGYSSVEILL